MGDSSLNSWEAGFKLRQSAVTVTTVITHTRT